MIIKKVFNFVFVLNGLLFLFSIFQIRYLPKNPGFVSKSFIKKNINSYSNISQLNNKVFKHEKFYLSDIYLVSNNLNHKLLISFSTWNLYDIDMKDLNYQIFNFVINKTNIRKENFNISKINSQPKSCFNENKEIYLDDFKVNQKIKINYKSNLLNDFKNVMDPSRNKYHCLIDIDISI